MNRSIDIIDPEGERRISRQRKLIMLGILVSLTIFGYPEGKDFYSKWQALRAGRKLAVYLSALRNRSILNKTALEARFQAPDLIEISEVSSCGPYSQRTKVSVQRLSDFEPAVQFAPEAWVRENNGSKEPMLPRFCYDPQYGSSVYADGLAHGGIFLVHQIDLAAKRGDHLVQLSVEGAAGDITIE